MKRELNKNEMVNDISLTISLILSFIAAQIIMEYIHLRESEYKVIIFFVLFFICIKFSYHTILAIVRKIHNKLHKKR